MQIFPPNPTDAIDVEIPAKLRNVIKNRLAKLTKLNDGDFQFSIAKITNVTVSLTEADLLMTEKDLEDRIIIPMLSNLNKR